MGGTWQVTFCLLQGTEESIALCVLQIAGVFESIQPSDTDLGAKAPKDVKITGLWYGQLTK